METRHCKRLNGKQTCSKTEAFDEKTLKRNIRKTKHNGKEMISASENISLQDYKVNVKKDVSNEDLSTSDDSVDTDEDEESHLQVIKRRQKIQQKRQELLQRLDLHQAVANFKATLKPVRVAPTASKSAKKRHCVKAFPARKSLRLQNKQPGSEKYALRNVSSVNTDEYELNFQQPISYDEHPMVAIGFDPDHNENASDEEVCFDDYNKFKCRLSKGFANETKKTSVAAATTSVSITANTYIESIKKLPCTWEKVVDNRIFSLTFNPRNDMLILAAGSKSGKVGIWDLNNADANDGLYSWSVHTRPVSNLLFATASPHLLYSCSFDGVLRSLDLQHQTFQKALMSSSSMSLSSFDFQDIGCDVIIVGCYRGEVVICDRRLQSKIDTHQAHDRVVKCISVHPRHRNYFATSSNDCKVKIFDFRKLAREVKCLNEAQKTVDSAYFSPLSGDKLLTTSLDDKIRIYDSSNIMDTHMVASVNHNNYTGRWLSNFRAIWHPRQEDIVVVGSMNRPVRQIDIFNGKLKYMHSLQDENLHSICSLTCVHPTYDVLAGGNSSGKVYTFGS
ncbi:WD repeat-containing protein 76-like [Clavelina lepadiformis]|uniref:WD repeat-containing protein 76-like n=1 Tax=Clavelina lepadiformis TaxID=159417 RepID=UPI00404235C8